MYQMRNTTPYIILIIVLVHGSASTGSSMSIGAQQPCQGIRGRVTTESGALLPGATIEAKNRSTRQIRVAESNDSGEYTLCLPSGSYDVKASRYGFNRKKGSLYL
jgi:hypothetical protein